MARRAGTARLAARATGDRPQVHLAPIGNRLLRLRSPHLRIIMLITALGTFLALLWWQTNRSGHMSVESFMQRHGLSAASIAFGPAGAEPRLVAIGIEPGAIMPYYSLSKPLTAAAVLAQVDTGTMRLDDRFAGASLRQMLQHTGGWDAAKAGDPVADRDRGPPCIALPVPARQFEPGTRYAYSNTGYCLLGAVLERATGRPYREAVRASFPEAESMRYDGLLGPAGGWSGTAAAFHRFVSRPIAAATTANPVPRPGDIPYGLGWGVDADGTLSHFGWLTTRGHFAGAVRRGDYVAVALFEGVPRDPERAKRELRGVLLALRAQPAD
jgi:CubicO group peptidase (beta-lactamase class C family)